jgi:hypothetical protein
LLVRACDACHCVTACLTKTNWALSTGVERAHLIRNVWPSQRPFQFEHEGREMLVTNRNLCSNLINANQVVCLITSRSIRCPLIDLIMTDQQQAMNTQLISSAAACSIQRYIYTKGVSNRMSYH